MGFLKTRLRLALAATRRVPVHLSSVRRILVPVLLSCLLMGPATAQAALTPAQVAVNDTLGYIDQGQADQALASIRKAIALEPERVEAHLLYIRLMIETGQRKQAQDEYAKLRNTKNDGRSLMLYGRTLEDPKQQEATLKAALSLDPGLGWVHYCIATLRVQDKKPEEAIKSLQQAIAIQPNFTQALESLGTLHLAMGQVDKAITHYREAVRISPDNPQVLYQLGSLLGKKGDTAEGIGFLEQSLKLSPANVLVMNNLAFLYFKQKRFDDSLALYDEVLKKSPEYGEARLNREVVSRVRKGDVPFEAVLEMEKAMTAKTPEQGIAGYRRVIELAPKFELPYLAMGQLLLAVKRPDDAEKALLRAVELNPRYPEAVRLLSEFYLMSGKGMKAEPYLKKAISLDPKAPELQAALGNLYLNIARYEEAEAAFTAAIALVPTHLSPPLRLNQARAIGLQGRYKDAVGAFQALLKAEPGYDGARVELGNAYFALEDFKSARAQYEDVLKRDPDNKSIKALLKAMDDRQAELASKKDSLRARQIMVSTEAEASVALAELKAGKEFTAIAKKRSRSPEGASGGDLGFFKKGELLPAIESTILSLKPGEISGVLKTDRGYHIFKRLQ